MKISSVALILIPALGLGLTGCNKTKQVFGLNKNPPNEFTVMERAPLELPPDYDLLPPQPGVERPQEASAGKAEELAKEAVLKKSSHKKYTSSASEKKLLEKVKTDKIDPKIRSQVNSEAYVEDNQADDKNWLREKLPFAKEKAGKNIINPKEEAERLKKEKISKSE